MKRRAEHRQRLIPGYSDKAGNSIDVQDIISSKQEPKIQYEEKCSMWGGFPVGSVVKNPHADTGDSVSIPGKIPWRRK